MGGFTGGWGARHPALIQRRGGPSGSLQEPRTEWIGADALNVVYRGADGPAEVLLFRDAEPRLELVQAKRLHDLLKASTSDSVCPAICMTEGCDYTTEMERDQDAGYCEACGGNTVTSALVLAGLI
jgi:hypothetical protein